MHLSNINSPSDATTYHFPTSEGDTYSDFINPTYAYLTDGSGAVGNDAASNDQDYYNFEDGGTSLYDNIPVGATILGVEIVARAYKSSGVSPDLEIKITGDDFSTTSSAKTNTVTATSYTDYTYGGSSDLWGLSLTKESFSNSNFRVYCHVPSVGDRDALFLDSIKVLVTYSVSTNSNPINSNPVYNNSINVPLTPPTLNITVNDADDATQNMNITWSTNASGTWVTFNTTLNVNNGTYYATNTSWISQYSTKYYWRVNTSDGQGGWDNDTYSFTTESAPPQNEKILVFYDGSLGYSASIDYKAWKEGTCGFDVECINVSAVIFSNTSFWVNGSWGDNNPSNPYYISQDMQNFSIYNKTSHKIRNYIRYRVYNDENIKYVILMGDDDVFPYYQQMNFGVEQNPCDLYFFGALTGTQNRWDEIGNGIVYGAYSDTYGSAVTDWYIDVVVSRMPFNNATCWNWMNDKFQYFYNRSFGDIDKNLLLYSNYFSLGDSESTQEYDNPLWNITLYKFTPFGIWFDKNFINIPSHETYPYIYNSLFYQETNDGTVYEYLNGTNPAYTDGFLAYIYDSHTDYQYDQSNEEWKPQPKMRWALQDKTKVFANMVSNCLAGDFTYEYPNYYNTTSNGYRKHFAIEELKCVGGSVFSAGETFSLYEIYQKIANSVNAVYRTNQTLGYAKIEGHNYTLTNYLGSDAQKDHMKGLNLFGDPTILIHYPTWVSITFPRPSLEYEKYGYSSQYTEDNVVLNCSVSNFNNDLMTIRFYANNGSGYVFLTEWTSASNGWYEYDASQYYDNNATKYYWSCNVSNGTAWYNKTFEFYTSINPDSPINSMRYFGDVETLTPTHVMVSKDSDATLNWYHNDSGVLKLIQTNTSGVGTTQAFLTNTSFITQWNTTYEILLSSFHDGFYFNYTRYLYTRTNYTSSLWEETLPTSPYNSSMNGTIPEYEQIDDEFNNYDDETTQIYTETSSYFNVTFDNAIENRTKTIDYISFIIRANSGDSSNYGQYIIHAFNSSNGFDEPKNFLYNLEVEDIGWNTIYLNLSLNPYTGEAWEWNDVDNMAINIYASGGKVVPANISQVILLVHFNPIQRNASIRTNGVDYFTWLGGNTTLSGVASYISGFDEGTETISVLGNDGHWKNYTGTGGGVDYTIHTFDVIKTSLDDDAGTTIVNMTENLDYSGAYENRTFILHDVGNGYNYSGFSNGSGSTLGIEGNSTLGVDGEVLGVWNKTSYSWQWFIKGFSYNCDVVINKWDVCMTKIVADRTWNQGG